MDVLIGYDEVAEALANPPTHFRMQAGDSAVVVAESLGELHPLEPRLELAKEAVSPPNELARAYGQHELALLVLMEQLYRVLTLRAGHPYHRP